MTTIRRHVPWQTDGLSLRMAGVVINRTVRRLLTLCDRHATIGTLPSPMIAARSAAKCRLGSAKNSSGRIR